MQLVRLLLFCLALCFPAATAFAHPALIPFPSSVAWQEGQVPLTRDTRVEGGGDASPAAFYLSKALALGSAGHGGTRIRLSLVPRARLADPEAYHLRAAGRDVLIEASDPRGLFHGVQTLLQLVVTDSGGARSVPAADIDDSPRFRWRGLLIDVSRQFFGKPTWF
jgi:hexosaminidase